MYIPTDSIGGFPFLYILSPAFLVVGFLMIAILTGVRCHFVFIVWHLVMCAAVKYKVENGSIQLNELMC